MAGRQDIMKGYTHCWSFPGGASGKNLSVKADVRGADSIPGLGRSPGGGHGNPLQYACLENPLDRGVRRAMQSIRLAEAT